MTPETLPFSVHPFQDFAQPCACVYLLVSAQEGGTCKLGVTSHLADRIDSLCKSDGALDLGRSVVIAAKNRRAALDLEGVLKVIFAAPHWRAALTPQRIQPVRERNYNGSSEWYDLHAFEPMIAFVRELMERDKASGSNRFVMGSGVNQLANWYEAMRPARRESRIRKRDYETDRTERFAQSEAKFAWVRAWVEERRSRLLQARPTSSAAGRITGCTFIIRVPSETGAPSCNDSRREWEEVAANCLLSYRQAQSCGTISYFGSVWMSERASNYSLELIITPNFDQAATGCSTFDRLKDQIRTWLAGPHPCRADI